MNSGKFRNLEKEFKPNIWVGNEYRGLCFCIESEKNITLADKNKYMILKEYDDYNEITINLLAKYPSLWKKHEERWLSTRESLIYDLIFQATPVKKFDKDLDKFLDLDGVRCEYMGRNFGLIPNFINYLKPPSYTIENVLSVCLIHNVIPRPLQHSLPTVSKIWRAYDAFGTKTADWHPYWENNASVSVDNEKVYISTFDKNGRTLAIISNFNEGEVDVELKLNGEYKNARNIFTDTDYEVANNTIKINLKRAVSYLLWIE